MRLISYCVALLVAGLAYALPAQAGRSCEHRKPTAQTVESGLTLAARTLRVLEASGQRVVLLARAGQDLEKHGVHYSHLAFAYRQPDGQGGGLWRVVHKLNQCGTAEAAIYRQGLGEFFLDDLWRLEAAYTTFTPDIQEKLLAQLSDEQRVLAMNHPAYSVVSYAWGRKYQQSNQWVIETLAAAMLPGRAPSREQAQAWLRAFGYAPADIRLGPMTRLGARLTAANVAFDDHPPQLRFSDHIMTVTADSVFDWLANAGMAPPARQIVLER